MKPYCCGIGGTEKVSCVSLTVPGRNISLYLKTRQQIMSDPTASQWITFQELLKNVLYAQIDGHEVRVRNRSLKCNNDNDDDNNNK